MSCLKPFVPSDISIFVLIRVSIYSMESDVSRSFYGFRDPAPMRPDRYLQGVFPLFPGTDPNGLVHGEDKNLPIAQFSGI
jgi:hypothetical protein